MKCAVRGMTDGMDISEDEPAVPAVDSKGLRLGIEGASTQPASISLLPGSQMDAFAAAPCPGGSDSSASSSGLM